LQYTPAGGAVTVTTGCTEGIAFLCVEDTGPGIPESERAKVLERFYRIPGTPGDGSGLGLSIVQEVVARHRGVLGIDLPSGHVGTRFCVRFPTVMSSESHTPFSAGIAGADVAPAGAQD
jgi:two-component system sensor histidine kinase TctE